MLEISKSFNIKKAQELLREYSSKDKLKKSFLTDLIYYHERFSPDSILFEELLIEKHYSEDLVKSVLSDLEYDLIFYKPYYKFKKDTDKSKPDYNLILFGIIED